MVGKRVCLVIMWPNPARRDKPWNYITLKFQRYTKHLLTRGNLYEHVEIIWGIQFQKGMRQKDDVLDELFQEQGFSLPVCELFDLQRLWPMSM